MGIGQKNNLDNNNQNLISDRSKNAIKILIIMASVVTLFMIIAIVIRSVNTDDENEIRRKSIIHDIKVVRTAVENKANEYRANPSNVELIGTSLNDNPVVINVNGIEEEYRYGYYLVEPDVLLSLTNALNMTNEYYIVNYDTFDVVNYYGVSFNKMRYHSLDDLLSIENGIQPSAKQVIRTVEDLEKMRTNPNGFYKLSANLDLSNYKLGEGWKPIERFSGTLDGRGYTISNLSISRPSSNNIGFFGELTSTANITNINFENVNVRGGQFVGALAGTSAGNISNVVINKGNISGQTNYTGGLVGSHDIGSISNCIILLDSVNGDANVGGLVGMLYSGNIKRCGVKTRLIGNDSVGGLIGFVSVNFENTIADIQEVCSNSQITGSTDLGGLIGKVRILQETELNILNSYSKGIIDGNNKNSGGFVGSISSVGTAHVAFNSLYTTLEILEKSDTSGACIGYTDISVASDVSVNECFWEKDLNPGEVLNAVGTKANKTFSLSFTSKEHDEMRIRNTFANWNFDIWSISERNNTPFLKWEI